MQLDSESLDAIAARVSARILAPQFGTARLAVNIKEAARLTGIDPKQISLALHRKELPGRRIGRSYRISTRALLDWVEGRQ